MNRMAIVGRRAASDVEKAVDRMQAAHVHCRDYGHNWGPHQAQKVKGGWERVLRCRSCYSMQIQLLNARGDIVKKPNRIYPPGYLMQGLGRLTGEDKGYVRLSSIADSLGGNGGGRG
jgi:hypothetical protein